MFANRIYRLFCVGVGRFFENKGSDVTPVISNIQVADLTFSAKDTGNFILHSADGS